MKVERELSGNPQNVEKILSQILFVLSRKVLQNYGPNNPGS